MKFFKKVLKNKLFYLVILLGVFVIPILKFNLQAQEEDEYVEVDSTLEFNVVDLQLTKLMLIQQQSIISSETVFLLMIA